MSPHNTPAPRDRDTTVRTDCFAPTDFPPPDAHRCFSHSPSHPARLLGTLTGLTHRCSCVCYFHPSHPSSSLSELFAIALFSLCAICSRKVLLEYDGPLEVGHAPAMH